MVRAVQVYILIYKTALGGDPVTMKIIFLLFYV